MKLWFELASRTSTIRYDVLVTVEVQLMLLSMSIESNRINHQSINLLWNWNE